MPKGKKPKTEIKVVKISAFIRCFDFEEGNFHVSVYGKGKLTKKDVHWALAKARDAVLYRE